MLNIIKANQVPKLGGINLQLFAEEAPEIEVEVTATDKAEQEETTGTFTQEQLNAIVTRETRAKQEKMLKDLGIEDFDNAKEGMKKFQDWQESQKTEADIKNEKLTNLEKDFASTKSENQLLKAQINAVKLGVQADSVEDVVILANRLVTEDVDMDSAIKTVIEKYPHFATIQAEEKEEVKTPYFSTGSHSKRGSEEVDYFQQKLDKYKK